MAILMFLGCTPFSVANCNVTMSPDLYFFLSASFTFTMKAALLLAVIIGMSIPLRYMTHQRLSASLTACYRAAPSGLRNQTHESKRYCEDAYIKLYRQPLTVKGCTHESGRSSACHKPDTGIFTEADCGRRRCR